MSAAADTVVVRISATIDNEYANRCPDFLPLDKLNEGRCELTVAEARAVLADAAFNSDRLFFVGDLIDRGPASERCVEFLSSPSVYAVRGNHEDMLLELYADGAPTLTAISSLPYAIEVQTARLVDVRDEPTDNPQQPFGNYCVTSPWSPEHGSRPTNPIPR